MKGEKLLVALIIFGIIVALVLRHIYYRLTPAIRPIFVKFLFIILFLGSFSIVLYTADNLIARGQVDMEGDAQYYYYGAKEYLETGQINVYYPLYVKFISSFLPYGGAVAIRLAQLFLFMLIYALGSLILNDFQVSKTGYSYYSVFVGLSGAYYGVFTVLVRDMLILFFLVLAAFLISRLFLLYDLSKLSLKRFGLYVFYFSCLGYAILKLQFMSLFLLLAALLIYWLLFITLQRGSLVRKISLILLSIGLGSILIAYVLPVELLLSAYRAVVVSKVGVEAQIALAGEVGIETNPLLAFFRFIFGPGLIRPLFPSEYFIVYTTMFSFFNWWGAAFWYANLLITVPLLIRKPLVFLRKVFAPFLLLFFVGYGIIYSTYAGGPGGLRKRAVFYFFYTLFIVITFFTPYVSQKIKPFLFLDKGIRLPYYVTAALVAVLFIFIHLRGI